MILAVLFILVDDRPPRLARLAYLWHEYRGLPIAPRRQAAMALSLPRGRGR